MTALTHAGLDQRRVAVDGNVSDVVQRESLASAALPQSARWGADEIAASSCDRRVVEARLGR